MSVVAVYNLKGGVGKTSTAVVLAYLAARDGYRTLLWDLDPQGAATFYYRIKPRVKGGAQRLLKGKLDKAIRGTDFDNLDLLPSDFSYRTLDQSLEAGKKPTRRVNKLLKPLTRAYDFLFIDCPDTLATLSESVFFAADVLLVPVVPTTLSLRTFEQIRDYLETHGKKPPRLAPFFCMVDGRKKLHKNIVAAYAGGQEGFLHTPIPFASIVERMGVRRAPLPSYDHRSRATKAYEALWEEVKGLVNEF